MVPKFSHSSHKSVKLFGYSFAFDAPTDRNSLPVDVPSSPFLGMFRRKLILGGFKQKLPKINEIDALVSVSLTNVASL